MNKLMGMDKRYEIRNDKTDKNLWVFEVYWADMISQKKVFRSYPNFISSRFKTKTSCIKAMLMDKAETVSSKNVMDTNGVWLKNTMDAKGVWKKND